MQGNGDIGEEVELDSGKQSIDFLNHKPEFTVQYLAYTVWNVQCMAHEKAKKLNLYL